MNFHQFFKSLFGFSDKRPHSNSERPSNFNTRDEFRNPIWSMEDDDSDDEDFRSMQPSPFGFRVFSDPIEIHRFFEHQMDQMMKSFQGFHNMFDSLDSATHFGLHGPDDLPVSKGWQQESLRDQYLKPIYELPKEHEPSNQKRTDRDLDDRVKANGLDSILKDRPLLDIVPHVPINPIQDFPVKTFRRSVITRIIQRPDGTFEHHSTVKDNHGNEETTVKRQIGDQMYTVTTQVDQNGVHKQTENFINIDEGNFPEFEKKWNNNHDKNYEGIDNQSKPHNWFPFDKFFR